MPRPSGQPARTMPTPFDRPAGDSLGGMNRGGSLGRASAHSTSAPASSSSFADRACPSRAATISGVWPKLASRASTAAPCSSSARAISASPDVRGKHQRRLARPSRAAASAPASSNRRVSAASPARSRSAAASRRSGSRRSRPRRRASRRSAISRSPRCTTQCSGGVPSRLGAFGSARRSRAGRGRPRSRRARRLPQAATRNVAGRRRERRPRRGSLGRGARRRDTRAGAGARSFRSPNRERALDVSADNQISSAPVPSPNDSTGTSSLSSTVASRFAAGVPSATRTCRPPCSRPEPPPASNIGNGS